MDKNLIKELIKGTEIMYNNKIYTFQNVSADNPDNIIVYNKDDDNYSEVNSSEITSLDKVSYVNNNGVNKIFDNFSRIQIGNDIRRIIKVDDRHFKFQGYSEIFNTAGYFSALDKMGISYEVISSGMNDDRKKHRLFVDIDGTLAKFRKLDTLELLYEKGYFANLEPIINVVNAINEIVEKEKDIDVYILSAVVESPYCINEKIEWLNKYVPGISRDKMIFPPCGKPKRDYIENLSPDDKLLDDYTVNLLEFEPPAHGIKLLNGINHTHRTWQGDMVDSSISSQELAIEIVNIVKNRTVNKVEDLKWQDITHKI